jgi:DNA-binding LytR/AlgR family response regulator
LVTRENKKYFPDKSLDKIEQTLPAEIFFRVNRQYIVHRNAVKGFKRADNGKLDVLVNGADYFPGTLPLSRTKAAGFKSWFQPFES